MNEQERSLLQNFLTQLTQVRGVHKDAEADELIGRALGRQPDAGYLLVQRALLVDQALEQAKSRIAQLEQAQATTASGQGFLNPGGPRWGAPSAPPAQGDPWSARPGPQAGPYAGYAGGPAGYASPGAAAGGGFSGFLGQAAVTAAGVAGGEFLFQGIENLLGHREAAFGESPARADDVTVNNYFSSGASPDDDFDQDPVDNGARPDSFADDDESADGEDFV